MVRLTKFEKIFPEKIFLFFHCFSIQFKWIKFKELISSLLRLLSKEKLPSIKSKDFFFASDINIHNNYDTIVIMMTICLYHLLDEKLLKKETRIIQFYLYVYVCNFKLNHHYHRSIKSIDHCQIKEKTKKRSEKKNPNRCLMIMTEKQIHWPYSYKIIMKAN